MPLRMILQPVLDRDARGVELENLASAAAFRALVGDPRVRGLREPRWIEAAFHHAARLAREVGVHRAIVPFAAECLTDMGVALAAAIRERV